MSWMNDDQIALNIGEDITSSEIQSSEPTDGVDEAGGMCLSKKTIDLIKENSSSLYDNDNDAGGRRIKDSFLRQEIPMGNTLLHAAAQCGNENLVENIIRIKRELVHAENKKGDTPLHVAARGGRVSILRKLLVECLSSFPYSQYPVDALDLILVRNKLGNTFFHEALLNGCKDVTGVLDETLIEDGFKELVQRVALFPTNSENKSVLYLAIELGYKEFVLEALDKLMINYPALNVLIQKHPELLENFPHIILSTKPSLPPRPHYQEILESTQFHVLIDMKMNIMRERQQRHLPRSSKDSTKDLEEPIDVKMMREKKQKHLPRSSQDSTHDHEEVKNSPLIMAILKKDKDILVKILSTLRQWIHVKGAEGKLPIHFAASIGYVHGVEELLRTCISCNMGRDKHGLSPLHMACAGGHTKVVKKLLEHEHCPDPREILDNRGRNMAHIAAVMGKFNVIRYILQDGKHGLVEMLNDKDYDGNSPLHLATLHSHPKVVHALTCDTRVVLTSVNENKETALDASLKYSFQNPTLCQATAGVDRTKIC
ncbi:hypothetical protein Fmac_018554 [Flemingia macrophylla]|uniref:Uncharacterized protein n=1 Tax=Flemingia macrophylla TaxID=520843 RepID=A0ABD1M5D4_9FABA